MNRIARRKVHFAPFVRQEQAIRRLVRQGKYRDVTHLLRAALDHYLDRIGHPTLAEQARRMADDFRRARAARDGDPSWAQDASRDSEERW